MGRAVCFATAHAARHGPAERTPGHLDPRLLDVDAPPHEVGGPHPARRPPGRRGRRGLDHCAGPARAARRRRRRPPRRGPTPRGAARPELAGHRFEEAGRHRPRDHLVHHDGRDDGAAFRHPGGHAAAPMSRGTDRKGPDLLKKALSRSSGLFARGLAVFLLNSINGLHWPRSSESMPDGPARSPLSLFQQTRPHTATPRDPVRKVARRGRGQGEGSKQRFRTGWRSAVQRSRVRVAVREPASGPASP